VLGERRSFLESLAVLVVSIAGTFLVRKLILRGRVFWVRCVRVVDIPFESLGVAVLALSFIVRFVMCC